MPRCIKCAFVRSYLLDLSLLLPGTLHRSFLLGISKKRFRPPHLQPSELSDPKKQSALEKWTESVLLSHHSLWLYSEVAWRPSVFRQTRSLPLREGKYYYVLFETNRKQCSFLSPSPWFCIFTAQVWPKQLSSWLEPHQHEKGGSTGFLPPTYFQLLILKINSLFRLLLAAFPSPTAPQHNISHLDTQIRSRIHQDDHNQYI